MIRDCNHFTVRDLASWNEALSLVREIDELQAAAGRATSTTWTQLTGPYNEIIVETQYEDLAALERDLNATMSDADVLKKLSRLSEITVDGKGYNEIFVSADPVGG